MYIHTFGSMPELARGFCEFLKDDSEKALYTNNEYSIALAGGSTPRSVFEILAMEYRTSIPWKDFHFYWGDERCVPPGHPESNYGMAREILFEQVPVPSENIHRMQGEANPEAEAKRYGNLLLEKLPISENLPVFDLVMLGMGEDGHTASIFPGQHDLLESVYPCAVSSHPKTGQQRITLTGPVILNSKAVLFLVGGRSKQSIFKRILAGGKEALDLPAWHIGQGPRVQWFCDRDAHPHGPDSLPV
ncbi:MAG: 6-phosphogluconolactonase [Bacteroidales bacterium]